MNLFVLGAGFIGLAFIKACKKEGWRITTCSRKRERLSFLQSIADEAVLWEGEVKKSDSYDAILFLAGKDPESSYEETYLKTAQKLRHKRVLYSSSTSVYGEHDGKEVDENSQLIPSTNEQKILIQTEQEILANSPEALLFRLGEIVGPGREIKDRVDRLKGHSIPSSGENITNIIHQEDAARALLFGLKNNLTGVYNLVSDLHIPRREWYAQFSSDLLWDPSKKSAHSGNKCVSNKKLKKAGFTFLHPLP